jgi:ubiquitin carboxyl-terminal hydrolase L3
MSEDWCRLESNPTVITDYIQKLGFDTTKFSVQDIFSTEDWALDMIKKPCLGITLVFPMSEAHEAFVKQELAEINENPQTLPDSYFYMKQYAMNACGSIALFHVIGNMSTDEYTALIDKASFLDNFFAESKGKTPEEVGKDFTSNEGIKNTHVEAVNDGDTEIEEDPCEDLHFISFVPKDGYLLEFDGMREFVVNHGPTTEEGFMKDAMAVVQKYIERDPENPSFSMLALAALPEQE